MKFPVTVRHRDFRAKIYAPVHVAVIAAMNCHNLIGVAQVLRSKWQGRESIAAGDDDVWTPSHPRVTKATEAAKAIPDLLAWSRCR